MVLIGSYLVDVVPFPFLPAFTVMVFLQITYDLNIWVVLALGVIGSVAGRYTLAIYIPHISDRIFNNAKNDDMKFLGDRIKKNGWKSQLAIFLYSLLPLPTTPLFVTGGMARMKPLHIIPAFAVAKFISDMVMVATGKYASENIDSIKSGLLSWQSIAGMIGGLLLIIFLVVIDWRSLLEHKKLKLKFDIFK